MFFRVKTSGELQYLQLVENSWQQGRTRQRVLATLGRLDQLQQSGQLGKRPADHVVEVGCKGDQPAERHSSAGSALVELFCH